MTDGSGRDAAARAPLRPLQRSAARRTATLRRRQLVEPGSVVDGLRTGPVTTATVVSTPSCSDR